MEIPPESGTSIAETPEQETNTVETPAEKKKSGFSTVIDKFNENRYVVLILAIIAIVSFVWQIWPKTQKQFTYEVSTNLLVSASGSNVDSVDNIEIFYKGIPVPELYATQIKIWNSGSEEIRRGDIATANPFVIGLTDRNNVYDVALIDNTNAISQFSVGWNPEKGQINIDFEFVNTKDTATIQVLHSEELSIEPELSIIGTNGEAIKKDNRDYINGVFMIIGMVIMLIGSVLMILVSFFNAPQRKQKLQKKHKKLDKTLKFLEILSYILALGGVAIFMILTIMKDILEALS